MPSSREQLQARAGDSFVFRLGQDAASAGNYCVGRQHGNSRLTLGDRKRFRTGKPDCIGQGQFRLMRSLIDVRRDDFQGMKAYLFEQL